jgi:glycine dehydrogenase
MLNYNYKDEFVNRHIGPNDEEIKKMLDEIGEESLDSLISKTIPKDIRLGKEMNLGDPLSEFEFSWHLKHLADKNKVYYSFIGMGYYPTITPAVIQRNILENPGWYTQYTPYQAEIAQGRLEALLNFQTMVVDFTGLPLTNASLLDEGTAAAEAMTMFHSMRKGKIKNANKYLVDEDVFPQTIDILFARAEPLGIEVIVQNYNEFKLDENVFGILVQYPSSSGKVIDYSTLFKVAAENEIFKCVAADLMSLALLKSPGEFGADAAVGSTQRFGVPMGYGGPHAAFFATKDEYKRQIPGRIIGVSIDRHGKRALRMALQTREQHIKRERATSNICTAQVLLAIISSMYAVYHGPKGIKGIAERIHNLTILLSELLKEFGLELENNSFFDTLKIVVDDKSVIAKIRETAEANEMNFRYDENSIGISLSETTRLKEVKQISKIFAEILGKSFDDKLFDRIKADANEVIPDELKRKTEYLTHEVFNSYHSETEMLRYIKMLEKKDLSLTHSMIPLGSCTMKLNATSEMIGITMPQFGKIHPFAPLNQVEGYTQLFTELENQLKEITGFAGVSLQPNSGAQGEYAGLMVIREYHKDRGELHRNVVLIPSSAHGTNPASAVMAGNKVVVVKCDEKGNIDVDDLKIKAEQYKDNLNALMVTYPSTHGVFEENIREICQIVHDNGGLVYMDGANMNAQVGLTSPAEIGADVCHLNLHKTFTIPHGGGGPGMGPICCNEKLLPYLPSHPIIKVGGEKGIKAISAAPWGSASILLISYAYIKMIGASGLTKATQVAILNANYIMKKLEKEFKVLYTGTKGFVGHELIFDLRDYKHHNNIEVEDVAKRLMDYGYHAPTVSFPVPGTIMVEPTESESLVELDRFCEAMFSIKQEINDIAEGKLDQIDNPLKNAPHTAEEVTADSWNHNYSRQSAAFPTEWTKENKFWPSVGRVDNAYGDRNLVCSCLPISEYEEVN